MLDNEGLKALVTSLPTLRWWSQENKPIKSVYTEANDKAGHDQIIKE